MTIERPWERFDPRRENILKMLHAARGANGSETRITDETLAGIATYLGASLAEVESVVTFYHMFARQPNGRHVIRVCDSLSCRITGSVNIYLELHRRLGVGRGETTADGEFSLETVNCLGSCDTAPNIMIDDVLHEHVHPEQIPELLRAVVVPREDAS